MILTELDFSGTLPKLRTRLQVGITRQYTLTSVLYFTALVLSLWNGIAELALCIGLTLLYLLPQKKPAYLNDKV